MAFEIPGVFHRYFRAVFWGAAPTGWDRTGNIPVRSQAVTKMVLRSGEWSIGPPFGLPVAGTFFRQDAKSSRCESCEVHEVSLIRDAKNHSRRSSRSGPTTCDASVTTRDGRGTVPLQRAGPLHPPGKNATSEKMPRMPQIKRHRRRLALSWTFSARHSQSHTAPRREQKFRI
jgi:hypothetical protein